MLEKTPVLIHWPYTCMHISLGCLFSLENTVLCEKFLINIHEVHVDHEEHVSFRKFRHHDKVIKISFNLAVLCVDELEHSRYNSFVSKAYSLGI